MKYKIKDIGKTITGTTPSTKNKNYYCSKDVMFVSPTDIKNQRYIKQTDKHISFIAFADFQTRHLHKNDIIIDCIGSDMGDVGIISQDCMTNQQINAITQIDKSKVLPLYLYYLLSTKKGYFHLIGSNGSTMPIISKSLFDELEFSVHNIDLQQHIVDTIGSIDDLIENYENQAHIICSLLKAELKKFSTVIPFSFYSPRIIKSGIKTFDTTKNYLDTSSVKGVNEIFEGETITFGRRPSRANMQPIANSVWFAKMKASNKIIVVSEKDTDLITGTIFSTGFLGIEATKNLPLSLLTAFLISDSFHVKRDMCSVGTTMASINNDSFLRITVPYLNSKEIDLFESKYKYSVQTLCLLRKKIAHLKQAKADLLTKYF